MRLECCHGTLHTFMCWCAIASAWLRYDRIMSVLFTMPAAVPSTLLLATRGPMCLCTGNNCNYCIPCLHPPHRIPFKSPAMFVRRLCTAVTSSNEPCVKKRTAMSKHASNEYQLNVIPPTRCTA
jgi:hypothetical protein